ELVRMSPGQAAEKLSLTLRADSEVTRIDRDARQVVFADGESLEYDRLVLASGARPVVLPFEGDATGHVYHINGLVDYRRFCEGLEDVGHVAIVGAGLIGCEFANDLVTAGLRVSVIDPAGSALAQLLPADCGRAVAQALQQAGVEWYLGRAAGA